MQNYNSKIAIIGSGFSGLSAAAYAAKLGFEVHVFEKHNQPGGRARQFKTPNGFVFDMGPSWYWMPDVIEEFFNDFGYKTSDFFKLTGLDPQFEMVFKNSTIKPPLKFSDWPNWIESIENGSSIKLEQFMQAAKDKYEVGMKSFVQKPCHSWSEFFSLKIAKSAFKLDILTNFRSYTAKFFKTKELRALMEFPVIFLGASPKNIPAMYSLMNYGGYKLGTWYPQGGFYEVVKAMHKIGEDLGVNFHFNSQVSEILIANQQAKGILVNDKFEDFDFIINSCDYAHAETLLPKEFRNYTEDYWDKKTFAPSCLIYYLGINQTIPDLLHHTLFFEPDLDKHVDEIYEDKKWPTDPLFYVCCPSKTDVNVAPNNAENLFLLMPLAINLDDNEQDREKYLDMMLDRIEAKTGVKNLKDKIVYKKSYCVSDFKEDYNAFGGNAYGLANTLSQTAVLKPAIKNNKIANIWYTGQLTVPGPGVPPSLISGKIVATEIFKNSVYEKAI